MLQFRHCQNVFKHFIYGFDERKYFWWNLVASKCLATYSFDVIKVVYKNDITLRHFVSSRYGIPFGLNAQMEQDRQMYQINAFCVMLGVLKKISCYQIALDQIVFIDKE